MMQVQKALLASHVQILLQESPSDGAFSSFYYRNRLRMLQVSKYLYFVNVLGCTVLFSINVDIIPVAHVNYARD